MHTKIRQCQIPQNSQAFFNFSLSTGLNGFRTTCGYFICFSARAGFLPICPSSFSHPKKLEIVLRILSKVRLLTPRCSLYRGKIEAEVISLHLIQPFTQKFTSRSSSGWYFFNVLSLFPSSLFRSDKLSHQTDTAAIMQHNLCTTLCTS